MLPSRVDNPMIGPPDCPAQANFFVDPEDIPAQEQEFDEEEEYDEPHDE